VAKNLGHVAGDAAAEVENISGGDGAMK